MLYDPYAVVVFNSLPSSCAIPSSLCSRGSIASYRYVAVVVQILRVASIVEMGSRRKSARLEARELTRELEMSEGIQAQLYQDAQKVRIRELRVELEKDVASNQDIEDLNASLVRRINMLKANYYRIIAGLERRRQLAGLEKFHQLQLSKQ